MGEDAGSGLTPAQSAMMHDALRKSATVIASPTPAQKTTTEVTGPLTPGYQAPTSNAARIAAQEFVYPGPAPLVSGPDAATALSEERKRADAAEATVGRLRAALEAYEHFPEARAALQESTDG